MKALDFALKSVRQKTTPKYVKLQCKDFINIAKDKDKKYCINEKRLKQIEMILKLLNMPKGLRAGENLYECSTGYQWLFYTAVLCVVERENPSKRRYETGLLEICRKNFKTYTIATLFILLFLTEPKYSKFFSVAPDGALSREIKDAIKETLQSSPAILEWKGNKRFKVLRDSITFLPTQIEFKPLSYSTSRLDGRLPNVFVGDEVGALPVAYPIEAMRSGQLNILNKLGCIISTKYPTIDNPFEDWVAYSKKVLDGLIKDETIFALLYEPDDEIKGEWETNDLVLKQSNPVALEIKSIWDDLLKKRAYAIAVESARENFVTKHCNIIYQGIGTETYVDVNDVRACKVANIDWCGKGVYVGLDLALSNDNVAVSMVALDDDESTVLGQSIGFIPADRIEEKQSYEKVDYRAAIRNGNCIACGDRIIDYSTVERYIMELEEKFGVTVLGVGYDRWNAISTAQKLEDAGLNTVEVKQHSSVLHPPTKLLREKIIKGEFAYTENKLLEINFQNARCTYDTNQNMYVNKKKSNGKVDMVVSMINAMYLLQQDILFENFSVQVI